MCYFSHLLFYSITVSLHNHQDFAYFYIKAYYFIYGTLKTKVYSKLYFFYIDESGEKNPTVKKDKPFVLLALGFYESQWKKFEREINARKIKMLSSKKQLQQAKTEGDKNHLERKCERMDKEIDQLVYQLYGLTEEEIKIVEESLG